MYLFSIVKYDSIVLYIYFREIGPIPLLWKEIVTDQHFV